VRQALPSSLLLLAALACAPSAKPVATPAPVAATGLAYPTELRWFRTSAEYQALTLETYRAATARVTAASQGLARGSWAVILDADETVLDNSEYQKRLGVAHARYSDSSWARWVREAAAPPVPGAADFTRQVQRLGGRVAIVTNRADSLCDVTRKNLASAGIATDLVLCQPVGESNKNPRFGRIQSGSAVAGVPALNVLAWIGDNIQDFPALTQAARGQSKLLDDFGVRFFVLPNPMYGSWEKNAEQ
jgi:5'-nucleotidase (lipoprotein e(P4) family)